MIRLPGRFIYLATPATGSRSISRILVEQCHGEILAGTHHAYLADMPLLEKYREPVYTLIRDPYDYVISRYFYKYKTPERRAENSLEKYIPKYSLESHNDPFGSIMCMYRDYVDRHFLFEKGLEAFFNDVGLTVEMLDVGKREGEMLGKRPSVDEISPQAKALIEQHFAEELELYRNIAGD